MSRRNSNAPTPNAPMSRQNSIAVSNVFEFPVEKYTKAQKKWVARDCIIIPTLEKYIVDDIEGKRLLDIGCGNGDLTHQFVHWGAEEVIGMDTSEEMINLCNAHVAGLPLKFLGKSSLEMDFVDEFDVITAVFMLQFSESADELAKSIRNISKALRPGGVFYAFVPNGIPDINPTEQEGMNLGARIILNSSTPPEDGEHLKVAFYNEEKQVAETDITFFYRATYERCLREAGFSDIEWIDPVVSEEGVQAHGEEFFYSYLNPPKDVMFRAVLSEKDLRRKSEGDQRTLFSLVSSKRRYSIYTFSTILESLPNMEKYELKAKMASGAK